MLSSLPTFQLALEGVVSGIAEATPQPITICTPALCLFIRKADGALAEQVIDDLVYCLAVFVTVRWSAAD